MVRRAYRHHHLPSKSLVAPRVGVAVALPRLKSPIAEARSSHRPSNRPIADAAPPHCRPNIDLKKKLLSPNIDRDHEQHERERKH
ncbi:hypothetical protein BHE74_00005506 [Ensete ventricosum]|nr:hypothetical protein BHE74_00005506 [Ensete ventricosum]